MTFIFSVESPIIYSDAWRHEYAERKEPLFVACFLFHYFYEWKEKGSSLTGTDLEGTDLTAEGRTVSKKIVKFSETPLKMRSYRL